MGNTESEQQQNYNDIKQGVYQREKTKNEPENKSVAQKKQVNPYREGQVALHTDSVLKQFLQKGKNQETGEVKKNIKLNKIKNELDNIGNVQEKINEIEKTHFNNNQEMLNKIREDFESYSKENMMGKKKLLEYYGLQELDNFELGNRFFQTVKNSLPKQQSGFFLDYSKFIKTISMLSQDNVEGRKLFLYQMFDQNLDGNISKEEFQNVMKMFFEAMISIEYQDQPNLNDLKEKILKAPERNIDAVLDDIVTEIFGQYQSQQSNVMEHESWEKWIEENEAFNAVMHFNPHQDENLQNNK